MPNSSNNMVPKRFQRHAYCRVSFRTNTKNNHQEIPLDDGDAEAANFRTKSNIPPLKPGVEYINPGEDEQMEVYGYRRSWFRTILCYLAIILTCGLLRLLLHWMPRYLLSFTHAPCSLSKATKLLFVEIYQGKYTRYHIKNIITISNSLNEENKSKENECLDDIQVLNDFKLQDEDTPKLSMHFRGGIFNEYEELRTVKVKKILYIWQESSKSFERLQGLDNNVPAAILHQLPGLTAQQQAMRQKTYGLNEIDVKVRGIFRLLFLEILNPFYIFQFFSFALWFYDDYVFYASTILIMTLISVIVEVIQTRKNEQNLLSTVHSRDVAVVRRLDGTTETISTEELVPGDVLVLPPHGCILHCDAVLLSGNCIVNESMLTGESEPVTKTPLPNSPGLIYDTREHSRHTLFCGTKLLQTRFYSGEPVLAVVVRTGFLTSKGGLVRSIMYPPPVDFRFERDSYRFIGVLAFIAGIGFIYTMITKLQKGMNFGEVIVDALDLITIVVPPALPVAMTIGYVYADSRLKKRNIFCISPRTINVAGSVDCVCFDKTGTLTEEGLDLWGVLPITNGKFEEPIQNVLESSLKSNNEVVGNNIKDYVFAMACTHSLTLIDGKLAGDPLDLKMFESTGWILEEPAIDDSSKYDQMFPTVVQPPRPDILLSTQSADIEYPQVGIVRQFPFSSSLQRMSVMVKALWEQEFRIFCKGAPEAVAMLCKPETVPKDFSKQLHQYTKQGLRVLAFAGRKIKTQYHRVHRLAREEAEKDLTLFGLLIMENRLKKDSALVVNGLRGSNFRCIMVTGDNILTALSVARECGLVNASEKVATVHVSTDDSTVYYTDCDVNDPYDNKNDCEGDSSSVTCLSPNNSPSARYVLAITGQTWQALRTHCTEMLPTIVTRGVVFARMSPEHKQQLIQELQAMGYCVGMVGDGANDCGALKAAHAGISLSDAESSVASPFTSKEASVNCVEKVVKEGRTSLVTSFGLFKFMAAYSLTQFTSVILLYGFDSNLTDIQFLFIDLFLITVVAYFFGKTEAYEGQLAKKTPDASLFSIAPIFSLIGQLGLLVSAQVLSLKIIQQYDWYEEIDTEADTLASHVNYAVFTVSSFQYLILAIVFSQGAPYRKSFLTNRGMVITLLIGFIFCLVLTLYPPPILVKWFELKVPDSWTAKIVILSIAAVHAICSYLLELLINKTTPRYKSAKQKHELVEKKLNSDSNWPQLSPEYVPLSSTPETPDTPNTRMQVVVFHTPNSNTNTPNHNNAVEVTLDPAMLISQVQRTPSIHEKC